jgi:hypothetical protein
MPNDDEEVDDFGESPHSSPTQAGVGGEENAMDDLDLRYLGYLLSSIYLVATTT